MVDERFARAKTRGSVILSEPFPVILSEAKDLQFPSEAN
jgi:hypothetical protein